MAEERKVDIRGVVDALVPAENTRIDQAVTDGRLTQEQADEKKAQTTERVTNMVNNIRPPRGTDGDRRPAADATVEGTADDSAA